MHVPRVRRPSLCIAAAVVIVAGSPSAVASVSSAVLVHQEETVIGTSLRDRPITAVHRWTDGATNRVVVLGQMHGNEKAGVDIARRLESAPLPANTDLWIIPTMNPDGNAADTRVNAAGVDLNRNFAHLWVRADEGTGTFSGPAALSEPETRAVTDLIARVQPRMTVSFHQPLFGVDTSGIPSARWLADALADRTGLPRKDFTCSGGCHGTFTGWHNDFTAGSAVTVELGPSATASELDRHAAAVLAVADETEGAHADPGGKISNRTRRVGAVGFYSTDRTAESPACLTVG